MITNLLQSALQKLLAIGGMEVRRIVPVPMGRARSSLLQLLEQASSVELSPRTVIDVGAAYGSFTRQYRPLDDALSQADIAFVKEHGLFRRQHAYATAAQRDAQNKQMQQYLHELFAGRS